MHQPRPLRGRSRCRELLTFGWAGIAIAWLIGPARVYGIDDATTISAAQRAFFEQKIRPVLVEHCYACHSEKAEKAGQLKGGLRLDTRAGVRQGGDSGPAVAPGKPEDSPLLSALRYDGFQMPPKGKLPATVIAHFEKWIQIGAGDPRTRNKLFQKRVQTPILFPSSSPRK